MDTSSRGRGRDRLILSDAIEAGAVMFKSPGPSVTFDCLAAAQAGLLGRLPTVDEQIAFYCGDNPWDIRHDPDCGPAGDLEYWLRLTVTFGYRWADVLQKLRGYGR